MQAAFPNRDHDIVGDDLEHHVAAATVVGAAGGGFALAAFEHAHHCFHLPTLAVGLLVEASLQQPPVTPKRWLGSLPAVQWWNHRANAQFVPAVLMIGPRLL